MARVDSVEVAVGLKQRFLQDHKKDLQRARRVWGALVRHGEALADDPFTGTQIPKDRFPANFAEYNNLWKLDLPHAFRAIYTVVGRPGGGVRVAIDWIGTHREYDHLFGYG